jgi:hypothetical protein
MYNGTRMNQTPNNPSPQYSPADNEGDGIDLVQVIKGLVKEKKRFIKNGLWALAIWFGLFLVYAFATYNPSHFYSLVLSLNFPQAAQSKYPNGSPFSASDMVSNTVLEKVWTENKLADRGIKLQDFQKSLTAIPYTGEINFIDTKYKGLLATKNLSRADIERIEAEYRAEVSQASSKNIKVVLDSGKNSYDLTLASKVLNDIATNWSQTAIEKLGVSRSPVLDGLTLSEQMKSESPYIVINYLNDVVYRAQAIITSMLLDTNSNSYRDEKSGSNLMGLSARLGEISNYQIDQLDAFVAINTKLTALERLQSEYKVKELQEQRKLLLLKAESNRQALIDYTRLRNQSNSAASSQLANKGGSDITGVQINGDAISRLVSLAEESKDAFYRQRLTDERILMENQANDLNTRIAKLERRINFTPNKAFGLTPETKKEYGRLLDRTWGDLTEIINAVTRIQLMAQKDFVGDSGLLYTLVSQPEAYSPGRSALKKAGIISIIVALFLSVPFTLGQLFAGKVLGKNGS